MSTEYQLQVALGADVRRSYLFRRKVCLLLLALSLSRARSLLLSPNLSISKLAGVTLVTSS